MRCRDCDVTWSTLDPCWCCGSDGEYGTVFEGAAPPEFDPMDYAIWGAGWA